MTSARWIATLLAVLIVASAAIVLVNGYHERKAAQAEQQAIELKGEVDALQEQAGKLVAKADGHAKDAATAAEEVRVLKAKLARIKKPSSNADPVVVPVEPDGPDPVDTADQLKDQIIEAQDRQISALNLEVDGLRSALRISGDALRKSEERGDGLESALRGVPAPKNRAIGLIYGPKTKGISGEMDIGPIRVGLDAVQRPGEFEAMARVMWRF